MELTDKVRIKNLCAWPLYFRRSNGMGDIKIPANAKDYAGLDVAEVQTQIQLGNPLFVGDGSSNQGDHARLYIIDDKQRKELLGYDADSTEDSLVLSVDTMKELFAIRKKEDFQKRLGELVSTVAEKKMIATIAKEAGGDDVASWKMDAINAIAESSDL